MDVLGDFQLTADQRILIIAAAAVGVENGFFFVAYQRFGGFIAEFAMGMFGLGADQHPLGCLGGRGLVGFPSGFGSSRRDDLIAGIFMDVDFLLTYQVAGELVAAVRMGMGLNHRQCTDKLLIPVEAVDVMGVHHKLCLAADQIALGIPAFAVVPVDAELTGQLSVHGFHGDGRQNQGIHRAECHNAAEGADDPIPDALVPVAGIHILNLGMQIVIHRINLLGSCGAGGLKAAELGIESVCLADTEGLYWKGNADTIPNIYHNKYSISHGLHQEKM